VPVGSTPCSSEITSQNLAPIWLPHWPAWMWTISRLKNKRERRLKKEEEGEGEGEEGKKRR